MVRHPGTAQQRRQPVLRDGLVAIVQRRPHHRIDTGRHGRLRLFSHPVGEPTEPNRGGRKHNLSRGCRSLSRRDRPRLDHRGQHLLRPSHRRAGIGARVEAGRRPWQPGQYRRLRQRHPPSRHPEIRLRRRIHPPGAGAEVDPVQIDLEDLLLGEMPFQPQRQQQFLHFPLGRACVGQEQRLRHLLSQRRPALHDPPGGQIDPCRAQQPLRVDAGMAPESPVLHRDDRLRQERRKLFQLQRFAHQIAVRGDDMPRPVLQCQAGAPNRIQRRLRPRQVARIPQHRHHQGQRPPDRNDEAPAQQPEEHTPLPRPRRWRRRRHGRLGPAGHPFGRIEPGNNGGRARHNGPV